MTDFPGRFLDDAGLNRQHVFKLTELPPAVLAPLAVTPGERQLILIGHAGKRLWDCVQAAGQCGEHPIDDYTIAAVNRWFAGFLPDRRYRIVYPGTGQVDLQALGALAGWHHPSPFMVGINRQWGSWFAYRCVIIADTDFYPTPAVDRNIPENTSPCLDCTSRPCVSACPAGACDDAFLLDACSDERLRPASRCARACLARQACPVGQAHRYDAAQIRHSYSHSLQMLENWRRMG